MNYISAISFISAGDKKPQIERIKLIYNSQQITQIIIIHT